MGGEDEDEVELINPDDDIDSPGQAQDAVDLSS